MTHARLGQLLSLAIIDCALLLGVGGAMWRNPPSAAEEAVGKGLVTIGVAVAIPTFIFCCEWLRAHAAREAAGDAGAAS